ncbi:MAG: hypothetical protein WCF67_25360 [Chitinophagaceae bacterium]
MRYLFVTVLFWTNIFCQTSQSGWPEYNISQALDTAKFLKQNELEKKFKDIIPGFESNRARLTLTDSGNRISPRELQTPDFPMPCYCNMTDDTLHIVVAAGMMAGLGVDIALLNDRFNASYIQEADGMEIFKLQQNDSTYTDRVKIPAAVQKLTLLKTPEFKNKEMINGSFEGQFSTFYQRESADEVIKRNYKAKIFFRCILNRQTE